MWCSLIFLLCPNLRLALPCYIRGQQGSHHVFMMAGSMAQFYFTTINADLRIQLHAFTQLLELSKVRMIRRTKAFKQTHLRELVYGSGAQSAFGKIGCILSLGFYLLSGTGTGNALFQWVAPLSLPMPRRTLRLERATILWQAKFKHISLFRKRSPRVINPGLSILCLLVLGVAASLNATAAVLTQALNSAPALHHNMKLKVLTAMWCLIQYILQASYH